MIYCDNALALKSETDDVFNKLILTCKEYNYFIISDIKFYYKG